MVCVPDSLALSLLIENNSTDSLEIKIFAPSFVNLEQSQVQLKAKEHKKVLYPLVSFYLNYSDYDFDRYWT